MTSQNAHWLLLVLINIPVFLAVGKMIFKDWGSFLESVRLWSSADWWYSLEKQWREDRWGTCQLPVFILLCAGLVIAEHLMFGQTSIKPAAKLGGIL